jgi:hypothetical protein
VVVKPAYSSALYLSDAKLGKLERLAHGGAWERGRVALPVPERDDFTSGVIALLGVMVIMY